MDNYDLLSNDEIRLRLLEYGFPNLPVTQTTRKVLVKKLRNAADGEKGKNRRETIAVTKFSSDEEVEKKIEKKLPKTPTRRATIAPGEKIKNLATSVNSTNVEQVVAPLKASVRRSVARSTPVKDHRSVSSTAPTISTYQEDTDSDTVESSRGNRRSTSKTPSLGKSDTVRTSYKSALEVFDNENDISDCLILDDEDSDDEPLVVHSAKKPSPVKIITSKVDDIRRKTLTTSSYNTSFSGTTSFNAMPENVVKKSTFTTSYNPTSYSSIGGSSAGLKSKQQYNPSYNNDDDNDNDDYEDEEDEEDINAPYLSNFAKRLSTLRAEPLDTGMEKYKKYREETSGDVHNPTTVHRTSQYTYNTQSKHGTNYQTTQQKPYVAGSSLFKDFAQILDSLDRQYNIRIYLYILMIVLLIIGIYVVAM
ncbi:unnamed protein product [Diamesa serratosioi]